MKPNVMLTITSLLLVLFLMFHLASDIVYGYEPGGLSNLVGGTLITVVWPCGMVDSGTGPNGFTKSIGK